MIRIVWLKISFAVLNTRILIRNVQFCCCYLRQKYFLLVSTKVATIFSFLVFLTAFCAAAFKPKTRVYKWISVELHIYECFQQRYETSDSKYINFYQTCCIWIHLKLDLSFFRIFVDACTLNVHVVNHLISQFDSYKTSKRNNSTLLELRFLKSYSYDKYSI